MKCAALPDQGNANLTFALLANSREGSRSELQIWRPGSLHLSLSDKPAPYLANCRRINELPNPWLAQTTSFYRSVVISCTLYFLRLEFLYFYDGVSVFSWCSHSRGGPSPPGITTLMSHHIARACSGLPRIGAFMPGYFRGSQKCSLAVREQLDQPKHVSQLVDLGCFPRHCGHLAFETS